MPVCRLCGETKEETAFSAGRAECRKCQYAANQERRKQRLASDPEFKARIYGRRNSARRGTNYTARHKAASVQNALRVRLHSLRKTAGKRGKCEVTLTPEDMFRIWDEQKGLCALTGRALAMPGSPGYGGPDTLSVDKVEASGHYTPDNVRFITHQANAARGAGTDDQLRQFCRDVLGLDG